jgi:hypothetical protein
MTPSLMLNCGMIDMEWSGTPKKGADNKKTAGRNLPTVSIVF